MVLRHPDFSNVKNESRIALIALYDGRGKVKRVSMSDVGRIRIRQAVPADVPQLRILIDASVRELQAHDYTQAQIEGALQTVFGVDSQLIADRTYLVADATNTADVATGGKPTIAGCGGWSMRKTLFGGDAWTAREDSLLDPARDAAKIRAFFVHPAWARRGVGTLILDACEAAARAAGFTRYEMGATLTGAKLFSVKGYAAVQRIEVPLTNGASLPVIHMEKRLPTAG
jgi:GNAT superfamily N-acetyltransferase